MERADGIAPSTPHLPFRVHFRTIQCERWRELLNDEPLPPPDRLGQEINDGGGAAAWIVQTYLYLRRRGHDVRLVQDFVPGALCVAHTDDLMIRRPALDSFIVAVQPDRARPHLCDIRLVQNPRQVLDPRTDYYVPNWRQPGLIPRDPERGDRLERVGFVGRAIYLTEPFRSEAFRRALQQIGVELVLRESCWYDYRDLDAVLAVRGVTDFDLAVKPASKLFNAWHAGCPALLGREPAYRAFRKSELDYFEVQTPEDALAALRRLKEEPGLYRRVVENGRRRRREVTPEAVAGRWERLLAGPIAGRYAAWRGGSRLRRFANYPRRALRHKLSRAHFSRNI